MAHWARIMNKETNETGILNTILADGTVAGNVVYWEAAGEPNIAVLARQDPLVVKGFADVRPWPNS